MKQEKKILIGVAGFVVVFFLLRRVGNTSYTTPNTKQPSSKTVTVVKSTTYKPVIKPAYVQSQYI